MGGDMTGSLGFPSKMPGTAYGISAKACQTGSKLATVEGTVCADCYAYKGNYVYPSVVKAHETRLESISNPNWPNAMIKLLRNAHGLTNGKVHRKIKNPGYHRWHDSGDIQSVAHLIAIVKVCEGTPEIKHWLPTKEANYLKEFVKAGYKVPKNLVIRLSAYKLDSGPSKVWSHTSTVHMDKVPVASSKPCLAYTRDNKCGPCRACWNPKVKNVSYPKH